MEKEKQITFICTRGDAMQMLHGLIERREQFVASMPKRKMIPAVAGMYERTMADMDGQIAILRGALGLCDEPVEPSRRVEFAEDEQPVLPMEDQKKGSKG